MITGYQIKKDKARQEAIDWQDQFADEDASYMDLMEAQDHFHSIGKRYGLLEEFRENGIPC